jgi:hypothetical protein
MTVQGDVRALISVTGSGEKSVNFVLRTKEDMP